MRDLTYPPIIVACKAAFRLLGQKIHMTGTEHVPRTGGAVLAINHTGYLDFTFAGFAFTSIYIAHKVEISMEPARGGKRSRASGGTTVDVTFV